MSELKINSILLPSTLDLCRDVLNPNSHKDGEILKKEDLVNYDSRTVLYDLFFSEKNKSLMAIGPPLLNLKGILFPLEVKVNGEEQNYKLVESYPQVMMLEIECSPTDSEFAVEMDFNGVFSKSLNIKKELYQIKSALITTQKNNKLRWIDDWIHHYQDNFGVDEIFIYDNGSDNFDLLKKEFPEVKLIKWDFPYGTVKCHDNQFTQRGMLNHFLYRFSQKTMIYQFDIDELAFLNKSKEFWIKKNQKSLYIKDVYISQAANLPEDYSFCDFPNGNPTKKMLRYYQKKWPVVYHHKYICNAEYAQHLEVHYFTLKASKWRIKLISKCRGGMKRLPALECFFRFFAFFLANGRIVFVSYRKGFISHFLGITTNWRDGDWERLERTFL